MIHQRPLLAIPLALLSLAACTSEAPPRFASSSPANPASNPAPRPSIAAVLDAKNPTDAELCAKEKPCAAETTPKPAPPPSSHDGHHHHHGP